MNSQQNQLIIQVKNGTKIQLVDAADVIYIESIGRKAVLHLANDTIEYYAKISGLEMQLGTDFFRIHRAYLINIHYIKSYDKREVQMKNDDLLLISKYRLQAFQSKMREYGCTIQKNLQNDRRKAKI